MSDSDQPVVAHSNHEVMPMSQMPLHETFHSKRGPLPSTHDEPTAANPTHGGPMTESTKPRTNPDHTTGGRMTDSTTREANHNPQHKRGPMTTATSHLTAANPNHGDQMPTTNATTENLNPNGDPMTTTLTHPTATHDPDHGARMTARPPDDIDEPIPDTLRMITHEDAARASLRASVLALGLEEVLVLRRIADRLRAGQRQYGFLHIASDPRTFREKEAREELEDALVYLACAWLKEVG
jgi:hypothetical protein